MIRWALLLMITIPSIACGAEVAGVTLADTVNVDGKILHLSGAGIRTKFFFDIYVGALYRPEPVHNAATVLETPAPSAVTMDFIYKEVSSEKLAHGWSEGFRKNLSRETLQKLESRLTKFNALFSDARRGDRYRFDFLSDGSTVVQFNGKVVGRIDGADFQRALLAVWLGDSPADADLKRAMLGEQ
ncbi:MAG TPA: chalcone isomerase family protein [Mariprofundaceae bacterium]|nr:chalcone isomerase family protein [Mariprofundaceae bacterium]